MPTCRTNDPAQYQPTQHLRNLRGVASRRFEQSGSKQSGFNLIELMIVVAIAAIGLSLALPSFNEALARNRLASSANEFIAATMYARTEALQRNSISGVCASSDQLSCSGTWQDGWIVWADIDRDGVLGASEVLRVGGVESSDTMAGDQPEIEFGPRGLPTKGVAAGDGSESEFMLEPANCPSGSDMRRRLTLTFTGQVRMETLACS